MSKPVDQLRSDAIAIWKAGVDAVDSFHLVQRAIRVEENQLHVAGASYQLDRIGRILVVGAGKAGSGMATGLLQSLECSTRDLFQEKQLTGYVIVPDDCVPDRKSELPPIKIHPARPAGINLPTGRVVAGTRDILALVKQLTEGDLCICLISGGGSALLSLPADPITLDEKIEMIDFLSGRGANIEQLNTVRKQISQVKGGRLAAACAAQMATLIISDVLGDPLDLIASGPTVADTSSADQAIEILDKFDHDRTIVAKSIYTYLESRRSVGPVSFRKDRVQNFVIGNIGVAINAAVLRAAELGYRPDSFVPGQLEGDANSTGQSMVRRLEQLNAEPFYDCWVSGGEPVVHLAADSERGLGGRNQQVVLAALAELDIRRLKSNPFCLLSGGTDGEDGPTDAAGAWIDSNSLESMRALDLNPLTYLNRNDAYRFFEPLGTLFRTGPTHTNVCDLRLIVVAK